MPGETSLLLPRAKTPFRSNDIVVSAIGLLLLLTLGAYSYRNSSSIGMGLYGTKDPPPRGVFHADVDQSTGLTGIYGVDDTGNYRLFARGEYLFNVSDSNWNYLNIESTPNDNDNDYITTMRAVGFLEGRLTCGHMKQYYLNFMHDMFEGSNPSKETQRFLNKNYKWTLQEANKRYRGDDYWLSVKGILSQLEGMLDGYRAACPCAGECSNRVNLQNLDNPQILHFLLLNADGDLYQITEKYSQAAGRRARRRRLNDKSTDDESSPLDKSGKGFDSHCSALIKLLPGNSDLLIGHDTWDSYESASPRSIKRFRLYMFARSEVLVNHWGQPIVGSLRNMTNRGPDKITEATSSSRWRSDDHVISDTTFSSSPGFIASVDDFYITSGGYGNLMITETSLDLYLPSLVDAIHAESVLCWMRATIANSLARSGPEWSWWFSVFHSGTYVNQWMVVDMNQFTPYEQTLQPNFLTVLEEMPALVHSEDQTSVLQSTGYWASFNLPFYSDIFTYSGASNLCKYDPNMNCYDTDPRYQLFKAHQSNVSSLETFMDLMTSNQFQTDPLSRGDPCNAISCRQDLESNPWIRDPFGAIDAKVSSLNSCTGQWGSLNISSAAISVASGRKLRSNSDHIPPSSNVVWARNGPTYNSQTPFCWSSFEGGYGVWKETGADFSHVGHPDCYKFSWQVFPTSRYDD